MDRPGSGDVQYKRAVTGNRQQLKHPWRFDFFMARGLPGGRLPSRLWLACISLRLWAPAPIRAGITRSVTNA